MRFLLPALALFFFSVAHAEEQEGIIRGRVYDRNTGEPLPGVYVIYGKNQGVITGEDGTYIIKGISGKVVLTFQLVGYKALSREISISGSGTEIIDAGLETTIREIDQVVVSASRTEQRIAELSVSMDIIKNRFLEENHITDPTEIINKTPGIEVMDGQASVRGGSGFSYGAGSRVLALIDGLPVVAADAGNIKWQFLPLENLSQIEIIKGASSVLYGSAALNGVINFRTADAGSTPLTRFHFETGFYGNPRKRDWIWWKTPQMFTSTSVSHLQKAGRTDIGLSASMVVDEGYRRLNEENLGRMSLKLKHFSESFRGLSFGASVHSGLTVKRDFVLWENAGTGALRQQESAIQLHGKFLAADPFISLRRGENWKHDLRMRFQLSLNRFPKSEKTNSDAYSIYTEYQLWHRVSKNIDLTAGLSENFSLVNSNMYLDHRGWNLAGYSQLEVRPVKSIRAVAGVRIENNSLDGINDRLVPVFRAGVNWQAAEYTFIRASFGQGYRFPSIAEKHASTTLGSVVIIPNPDVLPESGWSAEAGIKQGIAAGPLSGQADLSFFMSQNKDMIEYFLATYEGQVGFRATNIEQSRVYGGEFELILNGSFGNIEMMLNGGYTFTHPVEYNAITNRSTGDFLKYRRKHSGKMAVSASWKRIESEVSLYARSKILRIDSFFLNQETGEVILPGFPAYWKEHNTGYFLMDVSAGYRLNDIFTISAAVKNLTNTEYMGRPGDIQPQRNYSLRLSARF
jgi:iron complex outermembrane receptor protein